MREKAVAHMLECVEIATALGRDRAVAVAGRRHELPGPGRPARAPRGGCSTASAEVYAALPAEQELLVEYKFFEPAFYATDLADWGSALLTCLKLGERAKVLVDLGHHAQGTNIEQIVAFLADEGRLGGFHFNNRKYADDDLIVGSVNPFELFLIFVELAASDDAAAADDRPVAQHRGQGRGDDAVASSTCRRPTPRRCSSTAPRCARPSSAGDVLGGHEVLLDAFNTDVRPACAEARVALGARREPDPRPPRVRLRRPDGHRT